MKTYSYFVFAVLKYLRYYFSSDLRLNDFEVRHLNKYKNNIKLGIKDVYYSIIYGYEGY